MSEAAQMLRGGGRWLLNGPRRRRVHRLLNSIGKRALGDEIRSGPAVGLKFTGGDTVGYVLGISEPAVQRALMDCLHRGGVFYDVGAYVGFTSVLGCRLVGPTGQVHCFEPITENLIVLRHNLASNGFTNAVIHEVAASDQDGTARMAVAERKAEAHFSDCGDVSVTTARIDSLMLAPPTVVKIDVEGAEARVLRGMQNTLRVHNPVVIVEVHGDQDRTVRALLNKAGYTSVVKLVDEGMPHFLAIP